MQQRLLQQFHLLQAIRDYFRGENFLDVMTPPAVENPGMETHIHPFALYSVHQKNIQNYYLHTSPEFHMKELLSLGFEKIFNLSYCFRDEPNSPHHRFQFIMLEWYRTNARYEQIMDDCEKLITFCVQQLKKSKASLKPGIANLKFERLTIQELFQQYLKVDILTLLNKEDLRNYIQKNYTDIPLPKETASMSWDDYYFLLFLNKIEPQLKDRPYLLLYEFPHHLAALSTLKESDPRVCERFEIYLHGVELCNCFNELTDIELQKKRFSQQKEEKKNLYGYELPEANVLYQALEKGLPKSAGIALGVERLLLSLTTEENPFFK